MALLRFLQGLQCLHEGHEEEKGQGHEDRPRRVDAGHPGLRPPDAQGATGFAGGGSSGPQKAALAAARKGMAQGLDGAHS